MGKVLIKNGRVLDPASGRDEVTDVLIKDKVIADFGDLSPAEDMEVIDATDKLVIPGAIDLHVHLRDMEQSDKETIETGTQAAVAGGVTTVMTMPNTVPRLDCVESIKKYQRLIQATALVHVHVAGGITRGLQGQQLALIDEYPKLGIKFISDDGFDVDDEELLKRAYEKAAELDLIVMTHPEVMHMAPEGVINEGKINQKLHIPGQPNAKEYQAVERGIRLALKTGARAHFTHVSTKESIQLVREAKRKTDKITCDVTAHHISLTEEAVLEYGPLAKVNPPLRTEQDRQALLTGIMDGVVEFLVTDHAPHEKKDPDIKKAAFGFSGVETLVPATLTELYHNQKMDLKRVIELLTWAPARFAGLSSGRLAQGALADIAIVDLEHPKTVDRYQFISKGKNSPFHGKSLKGWPVATLVAGKVFR
ncbi:MAG: dihydroorotase [Candidatus Peregrinibacteria bacterium]